MRPFIRRSQSVMWHAVAYMLVTHHDDDESSPLSRAMSFPRARTHKDCVCVRIETRLVFVLFIWKGIYVNKYTTRSRIFPIQRQTELPPTFHPPQSRKDAILQYTCTFYSNIQLASSVYACVGDDCVCELTSSQAECDPSVCALVCLCACACEHQACTKYTRQCARGRVYLTVESENTYNHFTGVCSRKCGRQPRASRVYNATRECLQAFSHRSAMRAACAWLKGIFRRKCTDSLGSLYSAIAPSNDIYMCVYGTLLLLHQNTFCLSIAKYVYGYIRHCNTIPGLILYSTKFQFLIWFCKHSISNPISKSKLYLQTGDI